MKVSMIALGILATTTALAGGSTGGGNTVNHKLVEEYSVDDTSTLPGFREVDDYIKVFTDRIPKCGKKLNEIAHPAANEGRGVVWYLLPKKIRELPTAVTGLQFSTEQPAIQVEKEIFLSELDIIAMASDSRGRLYLHEILMMNHPKKDASSVRRLMAFLKKTNFKPVDRDLQNALDGLGFSDCVYKTVTYERELKVAKAAVQQLIPELNRAAFAKFLERARAACGSGREPAEALKGVLTAVEGLTNELMTSWDKLPQGLQGKIPEVKMEKPLEAFHSDPRNKLVEDEFNEFHLQLLKNEHFVSLAWAAGAREHRYGNFLSTSCGNYNCESVGEELHHKFLEMTEEQRLQQACSDLKSLH